MNVKLRWGLTIVVFLCFVCVNSSYATIQSYLNFQGFLVKSDGEPVTDGAYDLTVSLWDGPDDGADKKLWDESHSVTVSRGVYSLSLGANEPFPNTLTFTSQYYLGVQVSNGPIMKQDGKLIPLTSTWTAFRAKTSGGRCINAVTQNYTLTDTDDIVLVTGTRTLTLPSAADFSNRIFTIKKMDDDSNTISVATSSSETIDGTNRGSGGTALTISNQYDELSVISDGEQWVSTNKTFGLDSMATQPSDSVDIDGGVIDDTTIGTTTRSSGNFTSIDVTNGISFSAGSLDTMAVQASGSVDIDGGEIDATTIGGNTRASGYFTSISVTNGISFNEGSLSSMATQPSDSVDISGGVIDGTEIGTTTPSTGKFSSLTTTGTTNIESATVTLGQGTTAAPGSIVFHDNQSGDSFTTTLQAADDVDASFTLTLPPVVGTANQLITTDGTGALTWVTLANNITMTTAGEDLVHDEDAAAQRATLGLDSMATQANGSVDINGGAVDGTTIGANSPAAGNFSTVDIDGGNIDGTAIGDASQSTGKFTTITASTGNYTAVDIDGGNIDGTTIGANSPAAGNFTTVDINGGTIDSATIGATTPAEAKFTTVTVSGSISLTNTTSYFYLGDPSSNDGSLWRIGVSGQNLIFEQYKSSAWNQRYTITEAGGDN